MASEQKAQESAEHTSTSAVQRIICTFVCTWKRRSEYQMSNKHLSREVTDLQCPSKLPTYKEG